MSNDQPIAPHGGKLVDRWVVGQEALELAEQAETLRRVRLHHRQAADLELMAVGAYSPLEGFMGRADYLGVLEEARLANGLPWPMPVTLPIVEDEANGPREGEMVALVDDSGTALGLLEVAERYRYNKESEARAIFGTDDGSHPGVAELYRQGDVILAGPVQVFRRPQYPAFAHYRFDPAELRQDFVSRGWGRVACAEPTEPIHRGSEYLHKSVLETVDGLLLHVPVGPALAETLPVATRIASYEVLLRHYYPAAHVSIAVLPAAPRYAGPRETLLRALISKNYGCTHFLVPSSEERRNGYHRTPVTTLFARFAPGELGITPLFLAPAFYCRACGGMATAKTCPHDGANHLTWDDREWQAMVQSKATPPAECVRPEVARVLLEAAKR